MTSQRPDDMAEMFGGTAVQERRIAQIITSSLAGRRWRELTPLDIARHLVANGVRVVVEVTAAEQTVARMDTYSQEEHARGIEDAQERIAKRRAVRRNRAEAAAKYRAHVAACPREDHGTACLPDEGES